MTQYTVNVQATSNGSGNTADVFTEIKAASNVVIKIKRIRVTYGDGTQTAGVDNSFSIKLYRWDTTTGGTSASFTPVPRNPNTNAATSTVKIKSGTTALALGTTNVTIVDIIAPNGRAMWEWLARDDDDMIQTKAAGFFAVVIASPVVSQLFTVTVDFVE
jgi:hypothetical protein